MIPVTCAELAEAVDGRLSGTNPAAAVTAPASIDSRAIEPGGVFVALPGENVDGHDYVEAATEAGAVVSITSRPIEGSPCVVVDDPQVALGRLARYVIDRLPGLLVIGLTGSQGKTSTKDLIAQVLSPYGATIAPRGSFNNELGLPLTALRADPSSWFLVAEMGTRAPGDIRYLTEITPPRIGLVLNVGVSHISEFGSQDAIAEGKGELVEALSPDGVAVLNADDPRVAAMAGRTKARVLTFGESPQADVRATDIVLDREGRAGFTLHARGNETRVQLNLVGEHHVSNALGCAAVALAAGLTPSQIAAGLTSAEPRSKWRMEVTERPDGVTVINDAYNSNPDSAKAALKALMAIAHGARTWAVLGEMRELGAASGEQHDALGRLAVRLGVGRIVAVHEKIHRGASAEGGESMYAESPDDALAVLHEELRPGDVVLVKASRAIGLDRLATALIEEGSP